MSTYYPLAVGNTWTYRMTDGNTFTNTVTAADGDQFTMQNSMQDKLQYVKKDGSTYLADNFEAGNFQVLLKDDLQAGDTWQISYMANNFENLLDMTVLESGIAKEVNGTTYDDVLLIEGDMKMNMNGQIMPLNYKVQYYYAPDIGLILTTSSHGDEMGLTSYEVH
jgi:hypothetical protein